MDSERKENLVMKKAKGSENWRGVVFGCRQKKEYHK
jgi:hypothetical protein